MGETGTGTPDGSFATWGDGRSHSRCSVAISGNPLTWREMLSSQVPCFDKHRWCIRILKIKVQQERNTKAETPQDGFAPPSLVVLSVKNALKGMGTHQVFAARVLYNSAAFLYLVCVSALSICVQFGGKAMFGVPGCFSKCNMLQCWGNLHLYMRQREPQFHHEIKPIAVDFQMFHLQELLGVKSLHSEISCETHDIPEKKKGTPSLLQPENI